jgi:hypothetical protein
VAAAGVTGPMGEVAYSTRHTHEPQIPPAYDEEGRCLVCSLMVEARRLEGLLGSYRGRYEIAESLNRRQASEIDAHGDEMGRLERALRRAIGDQLEAQGKPREGPDADAAFEHYARGGP